MKNAQKPRLIEVNRNQLILRPTDVERLVDDDHPVRAIWEFVGRMDLSRFYDGIAAVEGEAGRSAWDPRLLICLWLYAYSQGVGSAREIERRCGYDPAYQWLTGMEVINHHTLADFRVSGKTTLDEIFHQTLGLLSADGLITLERVMHDGTKIKAYASDKTYRREERVREFLKLAEEQIAAMGDPSKDDFSKREQKAKERVNRERKEKLDLALSELEKIRQNKSDKESKKQARVSISDPESRIMKHGDGGFAPSYNAQLSTDSAHGIVVGVSITQKGTDSDQMIPALNTLKENFSRLPNQFVVDGGFTNAENIAYASNEKIDLIGNLTESNAAALGRLKSQQISEDFSSDKFKWDADRQRYVCPAGKELLIHAREKFPGIMRHQYKARNKDCKACQFKPFCCPKATRGRTISLRVEDLVLTQYKEKMATEQAKDIYRQRAPIAEFTNAWIKAKVKLRQFHVQGLRKVQMELQWACLALNIQYWTRLRWAA